MASSDKRIRQLDGLRACAIVAVFLHHAFHARLLWMGVDLFFVLSGFLITGILVRQKNVSFSKYIGHFYSRRVRRILPPYLLLLVVVALAMPGPWLRSWYMYLGSMNFLGFFDKPRISVLSPLWSLAVEEQFYLLWPVVIFALSRRQIVRCAAALVAIAPLLRFVCTGHIPGKASIYMLLPFRIDTLAAGALLALLWPQIKLLMEASPAHRTRTVWTAAILVIGSLLSVVLLQHFGFTTYGNRPLGNLLIYESTLGVAVGIFVLALLGVGYGFLTSWPLLWLGRISYTFYLIHLFILYWVPAYHGLLAFVLSVLCATASWFLIEKPLLSGGKHDELIPKTAEPTPRIVSDHLDEALHLPGPRVP